jgi:isoleucyl-tRNA synthetase
MQKVIDLGRNVREKKLISLKTPLKELVILHGDEAYLKDIDALKSYIIEELNVRDLIITSDEKKYGVEYKAVADWPVLGKKLKKEVKKVKDALPLLTSDEVQTYVSNGKIQVAGIDLVEGDLTVQRGLPENKANDGQEVRTDQDVLIILDINIYPELKTEGLARELVNRIQRLRKKGGLEATDDVLVQYELIKDTIDFENVVKTHKDLLSKTLRGELEPFKQVDNEFVADEEQSINDTIFNLRILRI